MELPEIIITIIGAGFIWFFNAFLDRSRQERKIKTDRYIGLISCLPGFYEGGSLNEDEKRQAKEEFIKQLSLCWLYCPDEVIRKGNDFLKCVRIGAQPKEKNNKEISLGKFVLAVRRDTLKKRLWFLNKTQLQPEDFHLWSSAVSKSADTDTKSS